MPNGCVPGKKSLLNTKLKKSKSGAAEQAREKEEEEVSPEDMEALGSTVETRKEGQERDKMAAYEHLLEGAFLQVL